jgi:hypothetical protein
VCQEAVSCAIVMACRKTTGEDGQEGAGKHAVYFLLVEGVHRTSIVSHNSPAVWTGLAL